MVVLGWSEEPDIIVYLRQKEPNSSNQRQISRAQMPPVLLQNHQERATETKCYGKERSPTNNLGYESVHFIADRMAINDRYYKFPEK